MANQQIGIGYGILCDPIGKQISKQGYKYNKEKVSYFEKSRNAINHLRFSDLLNDSMADKILVKLHNKVVAHVAKENKLSVSKPTNSNRNEPTN